MEKNGNWIIDYREGSGKMKYNNGDIYNGTWKSNQKCKGIMKYKKGDEYE